MQYISTKFLCAGLLLCDKMRKIFQKKLSTNFKTDIANDLQKTKKDLRSSGPGDTNLIWFPIRNTPI